MHTCELTDFFFLKDVGAGADTDGWRSSTVGKAGGSSGRPLRLQGTSTGCSSHGDGPTTATGETDAGGCCHWTNDVHGKHQNLQQEHDPGKFEPRKITYCHLSLKKLIPELQKLFMSKNETNVLKLWPLFVKLLGKVKLTGLFYPD